MVVKTVKSVVLNRVEMQLKIFGNYAEKGAATSTL